MVAMKCDHCGRRVPYVVETAKLESGKLVSVKNFKPKVQREYVLLCFRCAEKAGKRQVARG